MATIKLSKNRPPARRADERGPLRPLGLKRAHPTLAKAKAEADAKPQRERGPRRDANTDPDPRRPAPPADPRRPTPQRDARRPSGPDARGEPQRDARAPRDARDPRDAPPRREDRNAPSRRDSRPPRDDARPAPARQERRPYVAPVRAVPARPRTEPAPTADTSAPTTPELPRLSKRMSELGLASRREADDWIARGLVRVDGVVVDQLGARVSPKQRISVDPEARNEQSRRVTIVLHKPLGIVSGQAEDGHLPAVTLIKADSRWAGDGHALQFHPSQLHHLVPAGRLDIDSTGLLVLTQDGRVAKALIGADTEVEKEYVVHVAWSEQPDVAELNKAFPADKLALLREGLELDGQKLKPAKVSWANEQHLRFVLREGKRRQIRRMCEAVGLQVLALKRIRIGRIALGEVPPGQWRYLGPFEKF